MCGSGAVSCSCSLLIRGPILPAGRQKLHLSPCADSRNRLCYAVNNVTNLWGMQVVNLKTGRIITANIPNDSTGDVGLLHGIGWTPDQSEVWESSTWNDPHIYVWDKLNPMAPILKKRLALRSSRGAHWLTFDTRGGTMLMWRPTKIATKTPKYLTPAHTPP